MWHVQVICNLTLGGVPKLHATIFLHLTISSGARYVILHTVKLDEEYHPMSAGLAQENGFGSA